MRSCEIPIPDQTQLRLRRGARQHPINLGSVENQERALDVRMHGIAGENYYFSTNNPPYMHRAPGSIPELYVRAGILERLLLVNQSLAVLGYELFVFDAYRPVEVQNYFHDVWVPRYLCEKYPEWSREAVNDEVGKYWAKGFANKKAIDPYSPPPHATGGVVDLTLQHRETKEHVFMGSLFDEVSAISFADHFEREGERRALLDTEVLARANRRILYHAMHNEGFVVNPNEWWHFGFSDQLSAFHSDAPSALYSVLILPNE